MCAGVSRNATVYKPDRTDAPLPGRLRHLASPTAVVDEGSGRNARAVTLYHDSERPSLLDPGRRVALSARGSLHRTLLADMVSHMKTTVEMSSLVLAEARRVAAREGTTLRALIEEGLRQVLEERKLNGRKNEKKFRLRDGSFRGDGLCSEVADGSWERIRDLVYEGHGA